MIAEADLRPGREAFLLANAIVKPRFPLRRFTFILGGRSRRG